MVRFIFIISFFCMGLIPNVMYSNANFKDNFSLILGTTTTVEDSGLLREIRDKFNQDTGIKIHAIVQPTGQILSTARNGDVDLLLVHYKPYEMKFIQDGYGTSRNEIMFNDFILVGNKTDPANVMNSKNFIEAFRKIYENKANFISRSDDSGTYKTEIKIWNSGNLNTVDFKNWYKETGLGMGRSLNIASHTKSYILVDRASWTAFKNKGDLRIVFDNKGELLNEYGLVTLNKERFKHIKSYEIDKFKQWITSNVGQKVISDYKINGSQVFYTNNK